MQITTQASVTVAAPVQQAFALATDSPSFPQYFKGYGPIPAVLKVEWQPGARPVPGALRNVHNSDGSVIVEQLLELTAPERHRYRLLGGFKPPFAWMVAFAEGDWRFTPVDGGTRIDWHYSFTLRSPVAWPVVFPVVRLFFGRAMQDCLDAMATRLGGSSARV
jgi:hypothetical protein